jgi:ATP-dependent RNA helicase SUPV3L1/SUV3
MSRIGIPDEPSQIVAVLGPTNTGKTHLAIEHMIGHRSGMIGLPLRLLAREVFDRFAKLRPRDEIALITGEERIIPPGARYWVCTVEAMPLSVAVEFLAVDEIQLAADPERGHTFTDRILNARGTKETMFLGADTIGPLLRKTIPGIRIERRPRLSKLSFAGHAKLSRLPRRSAVIAYRADDVYAIAERLRRQKGGAAVVMGALSPRTRNAQVDLFENGEVDFLVATDAIGMGLNLSIDHIAFASLRKFDGQQERRLTASEIGQVAGRAGRYLNHGTFGTTGDAPALDEDHVSAIEAHRYRALARIRYRNADLDMSSVPGLLTSLEAPPRFGHFQPALEVADVRTLRSLFREPDIAQAARSPSNVSLLWQVSSIPDFQQMLHETHTNLLGRVFRALSGPSGRLPDDFLAKNIQHLDRTSGDIDSLQNRLAHIRTWTYIAHQTEWVNDATHWQTLALAVEDRLSEALHDRLTQRFVDRHHVATLQRLRAAKTANIIIHQDGDVSIDEVSVGRLQGLQFLADKSTPRFDPKAIRRELTEELERRAAAAMASPAEAFSLAGQEIFWNGNAVATLDRGEHVLRPTLRLLIDDSLRDRPIASAARGRISEWLGQHIAKTFAPMTQITRPEMSGPGRGLLFQLQERFGAVARSEVRELVDALPRSDRKELARRGIRIGRFFVFIPGMLKMRRATLALHLASAFEDAAAPTVPEGRVSFDVEPSHKTSILNACGFWRVGDRAVRIDALERLGQVLSEMQTTIVVGPNLLSLVGSPRQAFPTVMRFVGFRPTKPGADTYRRAPARTTGKKRDASSPFSVLEELESRSDGAAPT